MTTEDPEEMTTEVQEEETQEDLGNKEEKLNATIVKEMVILLRTVRRRENPGNKGTRGIKGIRVETETPREPDVSTVRSLDMFPGIVLRRESQETSSRLSATSVKDLVIWLEFALLKVSKLIFEL